MDALNSEAVSMLQSMLVMLGQKDVVIDGILGIQTLTGYSNLESEDKGMVHALLATKDSQAVAKLTEEARQLRDFLTLKVNGAMGRKFVPSIEIDQLIGKVSTEMPVPSSFYKLMVDLENHPVPGGYEVEFVGPFKGIAQFNKKTWEGIRFLYADRKIPAFELGVSDNEMSLRVAGLLYQDNKGTFLRKFRGKTFTDQIGYLYHQQGAVAAEIYLKTGHLVYPSQSDRSLALNKVARSQISGSSFG